MPTVLTGRNVRRACALVLCALLSLSFIGPASRAQQGATNVKSGQRYPRLVIRNATIVDGNGTPASGPKDIVIEGNLIADIVPLDPVAVKSGTAKRPGGDVEIDATGKYVLPGLINAHAHLQNERGGMAQPLDYELKLWLACGITTVRDLASNTKLALPLRAESEAGRTAAPRVLVYPNFFGGQRPRNADEARARVRAIKAQGADGIKFFGIDRDIMAAMADEAHKLGLPLAHHAGVAEANAWDDIALWHNLHRALVRHPRRRARRRRAELSAEL